MKTILKVLSIIEVVLGGLAIFGWATDTSNGYSLIGGLLLLACGIAALVYIGEVNKK